MKRGFTFGKYLPFHTGHEALINFALDHCDELIVLVCAGSAESIPVEVRSGWISQTYKDNPRVQVIDFNYNESVLPNTSVSSEEVSALWARKFEELLPKVDMLFTSEPYGDFVSAFMGIRSIIFDKARKQWPVSASMIRERVYENWHFLPDAVKPYYQRKVVLLGSESTGKSTMAKYIGKTFNAVLVSEAGRDIIPDSNDFTLDQLRLITSTHARLATEASKLLKPLTVLDTDIHITQSYAKFKFGEFLAVSDDIYEANKADLYLYLSADTPYLQDGTRLAKHERDALDRSHRLTLDEFGIDYVVIDGSYAERQNKVCDLIINMLP